MTRIAIIDHVDHRLYVEDINNDVLNAEPYVLNHKSIKYPPIIVQKNNWRKVCI